jgi:hypothetical protein
MKRLALIFLVILSACSPKFDRASEENAIREVLLRQQEAWNEGKIGDFMEGYWKSDSLMFVGSKITHGWDSTMARYKRTYPNLDAMGKLMFTFYDFKFVTNDACLVTGRYQLKRTSDEPSGLFTLLLRKKNSRWLIVYDHTS